MPTRAHRVRPLLGVVLSILLIGPSSVLAGGSASSSAGATRVGMLAVVGKVDDATSIFHNVGNLGLVRGREFYASSVLGYANASGKVLESIDPVTGEDYYSETFAPSVNFAAFPYLGYTDDFGLERWKFGVANYWPNLAGGALEEEGPARYLIVQGYFATNYTSFAANYKVSDSLYVGASLDVIYARQYGYQKINLYDLTEGTGLDPNLRDLLQNVSDIQAKRLTDTWDIGWHAGLHYKPAENVSIGLTYYEAKTLIADGSLRLVAPDEDPVFALILGDVTEVETDAEVELFIPRNVRFGANFIVNEKWNWGFDVYWWDYSKYDQQRITYPNINDTIIAELFGEGLLPSVSISPKNYDDSWEIDIGVEHTINDRWKVRFGVQYDDSPIPNETFTIDAITADQWLVAAGFEYRINENQIFGFGVQHADLFLRDIRNSLTNPPNNVKIIQSTAQSIMLEWRYR